MDVTIVAVSDYTKYLQESQSNKCNFIMSNKQAILISFLLRTDKDTMKSLRLEFYFFTDLLCLTDSLSYKVTDSLN